jgi:hypothetical protein
MNEVIRTESEYYEIANKDGSIEIEFETVEAARTWWEKHIQTCVACAIAGGMIVHTRETCETTFVETLNPKIRPELN